MDLWIKCVDGGCWGQSYILMNGEKKITSHFCSNKYFAHSDLFKHKETAELVNGMLLEEFRKIPIREVEEEEVDFDSFIMLEINSENSPNSDA